MLRVAWRREILPAVFVHIQKTAGTVITEIAYRYYAGSILTHGDYLQHSRESLHDIAFVSGHFGFEFARELIRSRYSFTLLRDPVDRVLSLYYFCRTRDPAEFPIYRAARELDLASFLRAGREPGLIRDHIWNNQTWQLACGYDNPDRRASTEFAEDELLELATTHLVEFSYVGFAESLERDCRRILSAVGVPAPRKIHVANRTASRLTREEIPSAVLELAHELTSLDRRLYARARELWRGSSRDGTV